MASNKAEIMNYIIEDYYEDREFVNKDDFKRKLDVMVDNNLGIKLSGREYSHYYRLSKICVIAKFLDKYEEGFIKNNTKSIEFSDYDKITKKADSDKRLEDLAMSKVEPGLYIVDLSQTSHGNYSVLFVESSDGGDYITYDFYIIGHNYKKFAKKLTKLYNKYNKIAYDQLSEELLYSNGERKEIEFKPFDKLIIKNKDEILKYIDHWVDSIPKYHSYGMIPKLSILLYGKPGTGKTTFYQSLSKYLNIPSVMVLTPDYFTHLDTEDGGRYRRGPSSQSKNSLYKDETLYAIDEIDMINQSREETADTSNSHILSKLLAFLDNPPTFYFTAKDGKSYPVSIVVATTNYYDRLDAAVKRFGRFDLQLEMTDLDKDLAQEMCDIYKLQLENVVDGKIDKDFTISPAELQAKCLKNIDTQLKTKK